MKKIKFRLPLFILMMTTFQMPGQFSNPKNLDFTWKTDTSKHNIDLSEITLVLPKGTFPKIDYPFFLNKKAGLEAFYPHEPAICVEINGKAKAYPLNMLTVHEISNDKLAGIPILPTYCPLCNAGIVYNRRIEFNGKKRVLEFEVSGMLRKSDMVMMDTRTETLWQQLIGEAIVGEYTCHFLEVIPSLIISVEEFFYKYPKGKILSNESSNEKLARRYGNNPYEGYDKKAGRPYDRYFDTSNVDPRLPAMERVIDIEVDGEYKIYPFSKVAEEGTVNDNYKTLHVVLFHSDQTVSAVDANKIRASRSIGSVTVFNAMVNEELLTFKKQHGAFIDDQTESKWDITGKCFEGKMKGTQLMIVPHSNHFAFAWLAFFPESEIYQ